MLKRIKYKIFLTLQKTTKKETKITKEVTDLNCLHCDMFAVWGWHLLPYFQGNFNLNYLHINLLDTIIRIGNMYHPIRPLRFWHTRNLNKKIFSFNSCLRGWMSLTLYHTMFVHFVLCLGDDNVSKTNENNLKRQQIYCSFILIFYI